MRQIPLYAAGALLALLGALCLLAAASAVTFVGGPLAVPAGVVAAVATFQALRVPFGRTAGRLLDA